MSQFSAMSIYKWSGGLGISVLNCVINEHLRTGNSYYTLHTPRPSLSHFAHNDDLLNKVT